MWRLSFNLGNTKMSEPLRPNTVGDSYSDVVVMARSKGTIVSVKVPINWDCMTKRQRNRLGRITARDTRVIRAYLGVIERHKKTLVIDGKYRRIDFRLLDRLTLTALRARNPSKRRLFVPHDFKARFPNISVNELQECRDVAIGMWDSYLRRGGSEPLKSANIQLRKIPRNIFPNLFRLVHRPDLKVRYWLELRDSLDSEKQGRKIHTKLTIPLKMSPFHTNQIGRGEVKSCRIVKDYARKWWVTFAVKVESKPHTTSTEKPLAVMGVDLGISKAACAVVISQDGVHHVRYSHQHGKDRSLAVMERRIASLQKEMRIRQNTHTPCDKITKKLREISRKRRTVNEEGDRVLAREIINHAIELVSKYDLYVAVGNPKGIRNIATKAHSRGRKYRGMIHGWAFYRVISMIEHGFSQIGWTNGRFRSRFLAVYEGRTSIICSKCGRRGIRPKQNLFICHTCGHKTNADKNGAINIARRFIRLNPKLRDEHKGLGRWLFSSRKKPSSKAVRRSTVSKRKSKLSQRSSASSEGESAAVRSAQMGHLVLGDEDELNDEDPAVENAAEKPSAVESLDSPRSDGFNISMQREEATFRKRNHVPMTSDKAHVTVDCLCMKEFSDDSHESGGTQELQTDCEFHSPTRRGNRFP